MPTISESSLIQFSIDLLTAGGAPAAEAAIVARSLVAANLRGHDSHGVMRIPFYLDRVKNGVLKPDQHMTVEREAAGALVCDGHWGFGQVVARETIEKLIEKARTSGAVIGTLRQAAHIGRLGEYAEIAAAAGMTAIICANNSGRGQRVAPVGGIRPRLGTNPICIGVPGGKDGLFLLDFGTSATAEGKVRVKRIAGEPVPEGWILDPDGNPTTDPHQLYGDPPGTILPMGGNQAYKGFGLSFMIELLTGAFSGGPTAFPDPPPPIGNCVMFIVINPELFAGSDHLNQEVRQLEDYVRSVETKAGVNQVTLPGDPERAVAAQRRESGIPMDDGNWQALVDLASTLGVTPPS